MSCVRSRPAGRPAGAGASEAEPVFWAQSILAGRQPVQPSVLASQAALAAAPASPAQLLPGPRPAPPRPRPWPALHRAAYPGFEPSLCLAVPPALAGPAPLAPSPSLGQSGLPSRPSCRLARSLSPLFTRLIEADLQDPPGPRAEPTEASRGDPAGRPRPRLGRGGAGPDRVGPEQPEPGRRCTAGNGLVISGSRPRPPGAWSAGGAGRKYSVLAECSLRAPIPPLQTRPSPRGLAGPVQSWPSHSSRTGNSCGAPRGWPCRVPEAGRIKFLRINCTQKTRIIIHC